MNICYNCESDKIEYSFGAMFHGCSMFCRECGCKGGMSDTEPKQSDPNIRMEQAKDNWNKGFLEQTSWKTKDYHYPPIHYKNLIEEAPCENSK